MIRRCACGVDTLVAVYDNGAPCVLDVGPSDWSWIGVWDEDGRVRASMLNTPPHAVRHQPHRCNVAPDEWPAGQSLLGERRAIVASAHWPRTMPSTDQ